MVRQDWLHSDVPPQAQPMQPDYDRGFEGPVHTAPPGQRISSPAAWFFEVDRDLPTAAPGPGKPSPDMPAVTVVGIFGGMLRPPDCSAPIGRRLAEA